jgi:hypothetical protein
VFDQATIQQVEIDLSDESSLVWISDVEGDNWKFEITECPSYGDVIIGEVFEDVGADGCADAYENGLGGCINDNDIPNFGLDGCDDIYENGEGGCFTDIDLNEDFIYISSDPNGDNVDFNGDNYNPILGYLSYFCDNGLPCDPDGEDCGENSTCSPFETEKNCSYEQGESFERRACRVLSTIFSIRITW